MGRMKTVKVNLLFKPPALLAKTIARLSKIPGVIKIEQAFPGETDPILRTFCIARVKTSDVYSVTQKLFKDHDVKSFRIAPLRKAQKGGA